MNILVIEDEPTELKLTRHVLSANGFTVTGVQAANQAFEAIEEERPEIILLDMSMPGMDGVTLVRKLKADPTTSDIFVVGITSYPEMYSKADVLAAGCDAYLTKPISTRTLPQELRNIIARGGDTL